MLEVEVRRIDWERNAHAPTRRKRGASPRTRGRVSDWDLQFDHPLATSITRRSNIQIQQLRYASGQWSDGVDDAVSHEGFQLVLTFGERAVLADGGYLADLQKRFPRARVVSCSSGGSILGAAAIDDGAVATAVRFNTGSVNVVEDRLDGPHDSHAAGQRIAAKLPTDGLRHIFLVSEGLAVNGSALVCGINETVPEGVTVSGGLAGDGERFVSTLVGLDAVPREHGLVAVGLYGDLTVSTGSFGGWEAFGPDRTITRSSGNVLYELDGRPVLELYRELLGPLGYELPASGLLFPLKIRANDDKAGLVRTILGTDEKAGSVTFAGDVPEGWSARLVRTNLDELIRAAGVAAQRSGRIAPLSRPSLALAVSCIGRKMLLQQRVSEELQRVQEVLGPDAQLAGFYSYGELASEKRRRPASCTTRR